MILKLLIRWTSVVDLLHIDHPVHDVDQRRPIHLGTSILVFSGSTAWCSVALQGKFENLYASAAHPHKESIVSDCHGNCW